MSLLEKMVMLKKLNGARGWHPNLAKTQLSENPVSGEAISRKRDEGPRKNKNKKREEEENLQWRMNIAVVGHGVGAKEGINRDSQGRRLDSQGRRLVQWCIWMAAGRSFGLKHIMTSAGFPTSRMKQEVWSTDSSNIVRYFVKRGQPTKLRFYSIKKTLKKLSYLWQIKYLNYSDSSNSPFAIKRKVSWKCVSCFSCKNTCFVGCPLFTKQELYVTKIRGQTDRQDKHEKASSHFLTILLQKRLK